MSSMFFDVEEELEKFTVRSSKVATSVQLPKLRNYKTETDVIPLLIDDIHKLNLPERSFAETISAYGIPFSLALIYGRISSTGAGVNGKLRYCLDDGTGLLRVRLLKQNALKEIQKIDLQCFRTFGNNKELYNSVQSILKTTREQLLDVGSLRYGTKALLIGRPHKLFEEVVFSAFEMIVDKGTSNDLEISVKNFIVDWYFNLYKFNNIKDPSPPH